MKLRFLKLAVILSLCGLAASLGFAQVRVLVDQVGYETAAPKVALIESTTNAALSGFALVDDATGDTVFTGKVESAGTVDYWGTWHFWKADFSSWHASGEYRLRSVGNEPAVSSCAFEIGDNLLERRTLSNVLYSFKGQRSSGDFDSADRHLAIPGCQTSANAGPVATSGRPHIQTRCRQIPPALDSRRGHPHNRCPEK
jgi:hypothetical protein